MTFLHRVANGAGSIEREYAIGSGRMDLCLRYGNATLAIELKVYRNGRCDPLNSGLDQLDQRLSALQLSTGWLVIFDRRPRRPSLARRLGVQTATSPAGRHIQVIRA